MPFSPATLQVAAFPGSMEVGTKPSLILKTKIFLQKFLRHFSLSLSSSSLTTVRQVACLPYKTLPTQVKARKRFLPLGSLGTLGPCLPLRLFTSHCNCSGYASWRQTATHWEEGGGQAVYLISVAGGHPTQADTLRGHCTCLLLSAAFLVKGWQGVRLSVSVCVTSAPFPRLPLTPLSSPRMSLEEGEERMGGWEAGSVGWETVPGWRGRREEAGCMPARPASRHFILALLISPPITYLHFAACHCTCLSISIFPLPGCAFHLKAGGSLAG